MARSNYHNGTKRETCYFCGAFGNIEEHHVIPQRFDGPDTSKNIVEVCDSCHGKLERLYDKSFYEWFGINDEKGERKYHRPCAYKCGNRATREIGLKEHAWVREDDERVYHGRPVRMCEECAREKADEEVTPPLSISKREFDREKAVSQKLERMTVEKEGRDDE